MRLVSSCTTKYVDVCLARYGKLQEPLVSLQTQNLWLLVSQAHVEQHTRLNLGKHGTQFRRDCHAHTRSCPGTCGSNTTV